MNIVPVISIVGRSESGKTTLIEKLIPELKRRGYRVASIKHAQEIDMVKGKDDSRHLAAGAEVTVLVSTDETVIIKKPSSASALEDTLRLLGDEYDIILCEGFKKSANPKIEVHRKETGSLIEGLTSLVAIVTDEQLDTKVKQYSFDNISGLADLIENGYIKPQQDNLVLYVNGSRIPLIMFPRQLILNTIVAMVSVLKGIGPIRNISIYLRKGVTYAKKS
jgi:molybdopterin-guanine dinucleotide biosynthesis adapter protein